MSGQKPSALSISAGSLTAITATSDVNRSRRRMRQNYLLIWVDADIDETSKDCQNTLEQLRTVTNNVNIFTELDRCIGFLTNVEDMKAFLIVGDTVGQQIIPLIHDIPQLHGIYMFCRNELQHEPWTKEWVKVKSIHTTITPICEALQLAVKQSKQDSIAVSFVAVNEGTASVDLNQLEPAFMYTQIFKEILLEMEYNEQSVHSFIKLWRQEYIGNTAKLNDITEFERYYSPQSSISWYTRECFIYQMSNQALRTLEGDSIINMGFFIRDLHHQIEQLHQQQVSNYCGKPFTVYRGQGLLKTDFEKLLKTNGGLMAFNNFLSTSKDREVSLVFAEGALGNTDMVGILFVMSIDPSISSAPFAAIKELSYFQTEEEILFSMHTVFRIGKTKQIDNISELYQVELQLTADDDEQLRILTKCIGEDSARGTGWERLGNLLLKIGQLEKAEELYKVLLEQASNEGDKQHYHNQLGSVKKDQGDYEKAIWHYEKELEIGQKRPSVNHLDLANSYNNFGGVYKNMGEYSKALTFYEKSLEILQKSLPANHPDLATSYNNIGLIYDKTGEYSKALSFYGKSLEIKEKSLPVNHPNLAISYNVIGSVYKYMGEYSTALSFCEKALIIRQKSLPSNHPDLATSYNNIGLIYNNMGEYSKALSFYEKSLEILQKSLPANHPSLAVFFNNIGSVYNGMGEHSKALSFYEKDLEIKEKTLPSNHPDLATSYDNVGVLYTHMGEYSKALSFYEKSLEIYQKTLPANNPDLATTYNNIGEVYREMGEYSKALSFYEKSLEISEKTLPANHPDLATSYNNIGLIYDNMGEYSEALSLYEKSLEIKEKTLPANHPGFAFSFHNIGGVYSTMGEHLKALSFYEKSLEICQKSVPANHPLLGASYNNIGSVHTNMGEYSKALSYFEHALNIWKISLPPNHSHLESVNKSIETVKKKL